MGIKIVLSNNTILSTDNDKLSREIKKSLTYANPKYDDAKRLGKKGFGIPRTVEVFNYTKTMDSLYHNFVMPIGLHDRIIRHIEKHYKEEKLYIVYNHGECLDISDSIDFTFTLRDYQLHALNIIDKKERCILVAPAGSGKTVMGLKYFYDRKVKAVWLVHNLDLVHQTIERAKQCMTNINIGIVGGGKEDYIDKDLVVCTFQTLRNRPEIVEYLNLVTNHVIVDEAHHTSANMIREVVNMFNTKYKTGLTATPVRKDGFSFIMKAYLGDIAHEIDRSVLYNDDKLIIPEVRFIPTEFKDNVAFKEGVDNTLSFKGDQAQWHDIMSNIEADQERKKLIVSNIIKSYKEVQNQNETAAVLIVSDRVEYCRDLYNMVMCSLGVRAHEVAFVHGGTKKSEREESIENTRQGKIKILFATTLAKEGLDIPNLCAVHLATPMKGDSSAKDKDGAALEQTIGRVMRIAKFDKKAIVYDYVDYNNSILKNQYTTRRRTYKRLGIALPRVQFKEKSNSGKFNFEW